jgi:hypothetical protein
MEKVARKPSSDPVQEKLRKHKDEWNHNVTQFIEQVKQYKKMMNGFPSKFHMEKSKIVNPLPLDSTSIISNLAGVFKDLAIDSTRIVAEQEQYSKTRRKKMPKKPGTPTSPVAQPTQTTPDLSAQLSKAEAEYELTVEGSSPLSRFLSRFHGPWFGDSAEARKRRYRLSMLKIMVRLDKKFSLLETEIMGKSPKSTYKSGQWFFSIEKDVDKLEGLLVDFSAGIKPEDNKTIKNEEAKTAPAESKETVSPPENKAPVPAQETKVVPIKTEAPAENKAAPPQLTNLDPADVASMVRDFERNRLHILGLDEKLFPVMLELRKSFNKALEDNVKNNTNEYDPKLLSDIVQNYYELVNKIKAKRSVEGKTLEEVKHNIVKKKASEVTSVDKMDKFAQRTLKKWVGKARHFLSSDDTSAARRDILSIVEACRTQIESLLDHLEEETFDFNHMKEQISLLKSQTEGIGSLIRPMMSAIKGLRFDKPFIDLVQNKKLLDYNLDMPKEQRDRLMKSLEREQDLDLKKMYRRDK